MKRDRDEQDEQDEHRRSKMAKVDASDAPSTLESLLDLSNIEELNANGDQSSSVGPDTIIMRRLHQIAEEIMHRHCLCIPTGSTEARYEILELEFYLILYGHHEDPFCHGSVEQETAGRWYFHRAPTRSASSSDAPTAAGEYRSGSRKGLDLTFGGPVLNTTSDDAPRPKSVRRTKGGILLRTIRRISDKHVISGPSLLVDELLKKCNSDSISELVDRKWNGDTRAFQPKEEGRLSLVPRPAAEIVLRPPTIHFSPRIGLDLSHATVTPSLSNPRVFYVTRPYRCFMLPTLLKANGRPQIFAGLLGEALEKYRRKAAGTSSGVVQGAEAGQAFIPLPPAGKARATFAAELSAASGIKVQLVNTYLGYYDEAMTKPFKLDSFIGHGGKGVSQSVQRFLQMIATLAVLRQRG